MKQKQANLVPVELEFTDGEFAAIEKASALAGVSDPSEFIREVTRRSAEEFKASKR
jgi:hypothetical protein